MPICPEVSVRNPLPDANILSVPPFVVKLGEVIGKAPVTAFKGCVTFHFGDLMVPLTWRVALGFIVPIPTFDPDTQMVEVSWLTCETISFQAVELRVLPVVEFGSEPQVAAANAVAANVATRANATQSPNWMPLIKNTPKRTGFMERNENS